MMKKFAMYYHLEDTLRIGFLENYKIDNLGKAPTS